MNKLKSKVLIQYILLISLVILTSYFSSMIWDGKSEKIQPSQSLLIKDSMTINEFGQNNDIPTPVLKKIFKLDTKQDFDKMLRFYMNLCE